jgi:protein required for attachment to host cells
MKKIITWVLVADGARAKLYRNEGPGKGLRPAMEQEFTGNNQATRDLVSDKPGRTFDSAGAGRHAKEPPTDPHRKAKEDFARQMAQVVGGAAGSFDRLIVVAPPQALGDLRSAFPEAVRSKITGELNKDLTHLPVNELAAHLSQVFPV